MFDRKKFVILAVMIIVLAALGIRFSVSQPARAAHLAQEGRGTNGVLRAASTFTVNSRFDPGDGTCDATECTLREAIDAANTLPGKDTIVFDIPYLDQPLPSVSLSSPLPTITDPVVISGTTQDPFGFLWVDGTNAGANADGLHITAGNSTVAGLYFQNFGGRGIVLETNGGNTVEYDFMDGNQGDGISILSGDNNTIRYVQLQQNQGNGLSVTNSAGNTIADNWIGADGATDQGNRGSGLVIKNGAHNSVQNNLVSSNFGHGIEISGNSAGSAIHGNKIGTDSAGAKNLGNDLDGIWVSGVSNISISNNLIFSNHKNGVEIGGNASEIVIQGNRIGKWTYVAPYLKNGGDGIHIGSGQNNTITGNYIEGNEGSGVMVASGARNKITANSILLNGGLGIDIGTPGVTPNDTGDGDSGANALQNFPVIEGVRASHASIGVSGTFNGTPNTQFRLEFFASHQCDPATYGEGEMFLDSLNVTTDTQGNAVFQFGHLNRTVINEAGQVISSPGPYITVTATDPDGNTSEFSACKVDTRPRILAVNPEYPLNSSYYLAGPNVPNPIKVLVDWNGAEAGTGDPAGGSVYFDLNGTQVQESGQSWGAAHTYDMGQDFINNLSCANNLLQIWATKPADGGGVSRSDATAVQPTVFPNPDWVIWVIANMPGAYQSFHTSLKPPLVDYTYGFRYPPLPLVAKWDVPSGSPFLGGRGFGLRPTQVGMDSRSQSSGRGYISTGGQTGFILGQKDTTMKKNGMEGRVGGRGDLRFICGQSLGLDRARMNLKINARIELHAGVDKVVPALEAAESLWLVGRVFKWFNKVAELIAVFQPGLKFNTLIDYQSGAMQFLHSEGTAFVGTQLILAVKLFKKLQAQAFGGGEPYVTFQVPAAPHYLKEAGINMFYGFRIIAFNFWYQFKRTVTCKYPGGCFLPSMSLAATATEPQPNWQLIPRDYAGPDYARFAPRTKPVVRSATGLGMQATAATTETVLLTNVYPVPEPSLAVRDDGVRLLAYVHDDTGKPLGHGTEIQALTWNGSAWSSPVAVTDDQQADFAPAVTFDGSGHGVLVWERSTLPAAISPTLDLTFTQGLEIAASAWNGSAWSAPVTLTNNTLMDSAPRLSTGSDGAVMALWETGDGNEIIGTATHPMTYTTATWNGSAWGTPTAILTGRQNVIESAFAVYSSTQAALVYAQDMDGVLTDTTDLELYYSAFDGATWSAPTRLTTDAITDTTPALAYDATGMLHLLWLRGGDLVWLKGSWNIADAQTVRADSTGGGFLGFSLNRAPNGNLALVWQAMGADSADLTYRIYDAATGAWGADQALTAGSEVEAQHSPAFASDGSLYLAYQKITTEFVTKTITISPTLSYTVTNLPEAGQSHLAFLEHTVGRDLTFDNFTITPTNPAPGQQVTLTAVLHSDGDLSVVDPQVAFYDGSAPIGSVQTLADLGGAYTTTVQMNWTVPAGSSAHSLKVTADPNGQVSESDETNNQIGLVTVLPDLAVDVLYTTYSSDALTVTVRLSNSGVLAASAPFSLTLRATDPLTGALLATATVTQGVAAGGQVTVTQAITDVASLAGLGDALWAYADAGDGVTEADETNNTEFTALHVLPDLTLTAGDILGMPPFSIVVHNSGFITATNAVITVRDGGITGTLLYSTTLPAIGRGGAGVFTPMLAPGAYTLFVRADAVDAIAELDESNNLAVRAVTVSAAITERKIYLPLVSKSYAP